MRVCAYESSAQEVARPGGWLDWVAKTLYTILAHPVESAC